MRLLAFSAALGQSQAWQASATRAASSTYRLLRPSWRSAASVRATAMSTKPEAAAIPSLDTRLISEEAEVVKSYLRARRAGPELLETVDEIGELTAQYKKLSFAVTEALTVRSGGAPRPAPRAESPARTLTRARARLPVRRCASSCRRRSAS